MPFWGIADFTTKPSGFARNTIPVRRQRGGLNESKAFLSVKMCMHGANGWLTEVMKPMGNGYVDARY
ncbi:hypothetical protein BCON_0109g00080 [Botryotinia convoluta]|uniref:Uncharacterized protein n=1 Tax=Botryotinia convoluta TaxID=54673 RepID=A0A4Z1HYK1_9HELO|nr:hypothetical protein BCON_0109g00080 [Botryotinia convoluta]